MIILKTLAKSKKIMYCILIFMCCLFTGLLLSKTLYYKLSPTLKDMVPSISLIFLLVAAASSKENKK